MEAPASLEHPERCGQDAETQIRLTQIGSLPR